MGESEASGFLAISKATASRCRHSSSTQSGSVTVRLRTPAVFRPPSHFVLWRRGIRDATKRLREIPVSPVLTGKFHRNWRLLRRRVPIHVRKAHADGGVGCPRSQFPARRNRERAGSRQERGEWSRVTHSLVGQQTAASGITMTRLSRARPVRCQVSARTNPSRCTAKCISDDRRLRLLAQE
jgi:hypothetical protein